jgi:adenine-specific DNA methylase
VFANDLNPVAALTLKATIEYPTRFGRTLTPTLRKYAKEIDSTVRQRLLPFFSVEPGEVWWQAEAGRVIREFPNRDILNREPAAIDSSKNCYLWLRTIPCPKCGLNIPLSTNFHIVTEKGKPEAAIAVFPEVPPAGHGNDCTFRIVGPQEWPQCRWPRLGGRPWHPREARTYQDGYAICPRCSEGSPPVDEAYVKKFAQSHPGGLPSQMYAVCSQVPVKLTYKDGRTTVRYLWRFRAPNNADRAAVRAAEQEVAANEVRWTHLIPAQEIPSESNYNRGHRMYGVFRYREMFRPRQLLTAVTVLEAVRATTAKARAELPAEEAEAVAVYLTFIVSKVINYNSVNTFWDYTRKKLAQSFSRHDFAFRPAFGEFEGARETVMWAANQVIGAYEALAGLIHGESVSLAGGDEEEGGEEETEATTEDTPDEVEAEAVKSQELADPRDGAAHIRPEVIVPTVANNDAAALDTPAPGTVHLICVDPPYYGNVQYSELSNFFYVWLKRALHDWPGLEHLFHEELAESNREAVANGARWKKEAETELSAWKSRFEVALETLKDARHPETNRKLTKPVRERLAREQTGPEPATAADRAEKFYEGKMAAVFRRAKQLLHPSGRMVVMFNHKMTKAWRALGAALIREGFEIRTSIPIHTEAESSLNIRGLDAARSTVLLLCLPREETSQVTGNWGRVQSRVAEVARNAAVRFQGQGLSGTDLYLSALGPALGEVGRHWPITDMAGRPIDLAVALDEAYKAVGRFRLEQILEELTAQAAFANVGEGFNADSVDKNTQSLWLWLDTFQGDVADSDDVRKLAKSLDIEPDAFRKLKLLDVDKDVFTLKAPQAVNLGLLARNLLGGKTRSARDPEGREADVWDERTFPAFIGAAVWNAIGLMVGGEQDHRGLEALKQWLRNSGYGEDRAYRGAFAVTLYLLRRAFGKRRPGDPWQEATAQAGVAWDLAVKPARR